MKSTSAILSLALLGACESEQETTKFKRDPALEPVLVLPTLTEDTPLSSWGQMVGMAQCRNQVVHALRASEVYDSEFIALKMCDELIHDGTIEPVESWTEPTYLDLDGDGYSAKLDCDDLSRFTYPGAYERENGEDNNCDGVADIDIASVPQGMPEIVRYESRYPRGVEPIQSPVCKWEQGRDPWYPEEWTLGNYFDSNGHWAPKLKDVRNCAPKRSIAWDDLLKSSLDSMEAYADRDWNSIAVRVSYGLLQNSGDLLYGDVPFTSDFRRGTMRSIYQDPALQEEIYKWAMPYVIDRFEDLSDEGQSDYLDVFRHMVAYAGDFNYGKELDYYNELAASRACNPTDWHIANGGGGCLQRFTSYSPSDKETVNPYRKAEAWMFRRVNNGEMTPTQILGWLERIEFDLTAATTEND